MGANSVKKWLRISKRFVVSVGFGLVLSIYLLQNTQRSHEYVLDFVTNQFEHQLSSSFTGRIKSIDLFRLRFVFEDVLVESLDATKEWSWKAETFTVACSLWNVFAEGALGIYVALENLQTVSASRGIYLDALPHLLDLFYAYEGDIPISFKSVIIKDGFLHAYTHDGYYADVWWNSDFERDAIDDRAHFYITRARIYSDLLEYIDETSGTLQLHVDDSWHLFTDIRFKNIYSDTRNNPYFFTGSWENDEGNWSLTSLSGNCVTDSFSVKCKDDHYRLSLAGSIETELIYPLLGTSGECSVKLDGSYTLQDYSITNATGLVTLNNLATIYGMVDQLKATVMKNDDIFKGTLTAQKNYYCLNGSWKWDNAQKKGLMELHNEKITAIPQSYWIIPPGKLHASCTFDNQLNVTAQLDCICEHEKLAASMRCIGTLKADREGFDLNGTVGNCSLQLCGIASFPFIQRARLYQNEQELIAATVENGETSLCVDYNFIHQLLPENVRKHSIGQGTIQFDGNISKEKAIGSLHLNNGTIHVPMTDNFIDSFRCGVAVDVQDKKLVLSDCMIGFHHGALTSSRMTFFFDQWGVPTFINAPIIIDNWFANWQKHCTSLFSGTLNLVKEQEKVSLEGALFMDESRINQSFLTEQMQRTFKGAPLFWMQKLDKWYIDCKCITRKPITIDTSLCKTMCSIDTHITGLMRNPNITGVITLLGGQLYFPHKSLNITKGRLNFTGQKWHEAIIGLYAKRRIKRYMVDMHVSGSVCKPQVDFNSHPALTTEQILALLLGGSEKGALSTSVPAIVFHNAYSWLFGLNDASSQDGTFKQFMRAFNRIHFVPTVSKKGLRGALQIDLTDDFHATIAKDFANHEQTSLELEYQLNNALSLRGKRDERGDMGADVELRWKF